MTKWMRQSKGVSLIEAPAAVIVLSIALLGGCIIYACGVMLGDQPTKVSIVHHAEAEAVSDLEQSGCSIAFEPITKTLGGQTAPALAPTEGKGRN